MFLRFLSPKLDQGGPSLRFLQGWDAMLRTPYSSVTPRGSGLAHLCVTPTLAASPFAFFRRESTTDIDISRFFSLAIRPSGFRSPAQGHALRHCNGGSCSNPAVPVALYVMNELRDQGLWCPRFEITKHGAASFVAMQRWASPPWISSSLRWSPVTVKSLPHISEQWPSFVTTASYVFNNIGNFMSSVGLCELALARLLPVPMNTA
jgi:hypothetical protein